MDGSGSGSGANNSSDTELHVGHPSLPLLAVYGAVLGGLLVLVVVTVVTTMVCNRRRRKSTNAYYTVTKTINPPRRNNSRTGSLRTNAGVLEFQQDQLRSEEGAIHSMELLYTQELEQTTSTPHPFISSLVTTREEDGADETADSSLISGDASDGEEGDGESAQTAGVGIYGDPECNELSVAPQEQDKTKQLSQQFAFEDGTLLQDYPPTVDVGVAEDGGEAEKANIMGYCDIYNSQILQTVPTEEQTASEKKESSKGNVQKSQSQRARKRVRLSLPDRESLALSTPETRARGLSGLVVPQVVIEEPASKALSRSRYSDSRLLSEASPGYVEAQEFLNKSLTDLLEMTEALSQDMSDHEQDIELDIEQTMDGDLPLSEDESCVHLQMESTSQIKPTSITPQFSAASLHHITPSEDAPDRSSVLVNPSLSERASQCSDVNLMEFITPDDLADLDPDIQSTLLRGCDTEGLQITQV